MNPPTRNDLIVYEKSNLNCEAVRTTSVLFLTKERKIALGLPQMVSISIGFEV
jgi:hypothetical protein